MSTWNIVVPRWTETKHRLGDKKVWEVEFEPVHSLVTNGGEEHAIAFAKELGFRNPILEKIQ